MSHVNVSKYNFFLKKVLIFFYLNLDFTPCCCSSNFLDTDLIPKSSSSDSLLLFSNFKNINEYNVAVFKDTHYKCCNVKQIRDIVDKSLKNTICIPENHRYAISQFVKRKGKIVFEDKKTIESAIYHVENDKGKRIAILNFANWCNCGGGVTGGCTAQEESICRCTSVYINLEKNKKQFYDVHKKMVEEDKNAAQKANNDIIYSPDVYIMKDDKIPNNIVTLKVDPNRVVDVITCAAPNNAIGKELTSVEIYEIHKSRIKRILEVALLMNVSVIILGAHGCGVFRNDPYAVAKAYSDVFKIYGPYFEKIILAIPINGNDENYRIFKSVISDGELIK